MQNFWLHLAEKRSILDKTCRNVNYYIFYGGKMKEKHIVSFRDVDRPIGEYPKGTFFAQDHDDIVIPMPTKEELEEYKKKHDTTSQ